MDRMFRCSLRTGKYRTGRMRRCCRLEKAPGAPRVRFERVDFSYEPRRAILFDVSFEVPGGASRRLRT